jgi:hypothetical protein
MQLVGHKVRFTFFYLQTRVSKDLSCIRLDFSKSANTL